MKADSENQLDVHTSGNRCTLVFRDNWNLQKGIPSADRVLKQMPAVEQLNEIAFDASQLRGWDSSLPVFLTQLNESLQKNHLAVDWSGLPDGVKRLLKLRDDSATGDAYEFAPGQTSYPSPFVFLKRAWQEFLCFLVFIGETLAAFVKWGRGKGSFRWKDFWLLFEACGIRAIPIVMLIGFLVGLIMAFVGAMQLAMFGAEIYIANLVGISMVREMGPMMCAMVMSGRTGAAFAAQLGSMKVTEEIDALRTMGVEPTGYLVIPRILALSLTMPILCMFADATGIMGGFMVGSGLMDIAPAQYINQTDFAVRPQSFVIGLVKAWVFGIIIAMTGCLRGMQSGSSSSAVGEASTSAVVTSITLIIIADALFAIILNFLGL